MNEVRQDLEDMGCRRILMQQPCVGLSVITDPTVQEPWEERLILLISDHRMPRRQTEASGAHQLLSVDDSPPQQ